MAPLKVNQALQLCQVNLAFLPPAAVCATQTWAHHSLPFDVSFTSAWSKPNPPTLLSPAPFKPSHDWHHLCSVSWTRKDQGDFSKYSKSKWLVFLWWLACVGNPVWIAGAYYQPSLGRVNQSAWSTQDEHLWMKPQEKHIKPTHSTSYVAIVGYLQEL